MSDYLSKITALLERIETEESAALDRASSAVADGAPGTAAMRTETFAHAAASAKPVRASTATGTGISSPSGPANAASIVKGKNEKRNRAWSLMRAV